MWTSSHKLCHWFRKEKKKKEKAKRKENIPPPNQI